MLFSAPAADGDDDNEDESNLVSERLPPQLAIVCTGTHKLLMTGLIFWFERRRASIRSNSCLIVRFVGLFADLALFNLPELQL